jgi:hypothetical protein
MNNIIYKENGAGAIVKHLLNLKKRLDFSEFDATI